MKVSQVATVAALAVAAQAQDDSTCTSFFTDTCIFDPFTSIATASFGCASGDFNCYCTNSFAIVTDVGFLGDCTNAFDNTDTYSSFCACATADAVTTTTDEPTTTTPETTTTPTDVTSPTDVTTPTSTNTGVTNTSSGSSKSSASGVTSKSSASGSGSSKSSGSSSRSSGITGPVASPTLTGTTVVPIGSSKTSIAISKFTGAAGTASAFMPIGGVLGAVAGLVAYL